MLEDIKTVAVTPYIGQQHHYVFVYVTGHFLATIYKPLAESSGVA